ncbi:MAG: pyroglutamyl-peptidase I [Alphaproteobacteria bacterium]|nr:pyroglutamyl-peptidase I [Alphaproteobacteria bacterium]
MDVLVTGFEPFGNSDRNPSREVARVLDGRTIAGLKVTGRVLPVSMRAIGDALARVFEDPPPRIVVALGLANGESMVRIERYGVNLADFPLADNDGEKVVDRAIVPDGPPSFATTLPNRAIREALLQAGIPARLSNTAGTYLCNASIYLLGDMIRKRALETRFGFLHLPYMPEQVAALLATPHAERQPKQVPSMSLATMLRAVETAVATAAASSI